MAEELNLDEIIFPFFASDIEKPYPIGRVSLRQFLRSHKRPNKGIVELIEKIKKASEEGNLKLKDELKRQLYCFTPCVNIKGVRRYSEIINFTGCLVLDFDKIDNAEEFKHFLFNALPCVICAYTSPSRRGVKFICKIEKVNTVEEFKSLFYGLAFHLEKYEGFDGSSQSPILPLFLSYDEDLLFRHDPETWTIRGEKINELKPYVGEIETVDDVSEKDRNIIFNNIRIALEKIDNTAHVAIRSISLVAGGYCGSGYINEQEAISFIYDIISDIPYCQKNLNGYLLTIKQMVQRGQKNPLYLEEKE